LKITNRPFRNCVKPMAEKTDSPEEIAKLHVLKALFAPDSSGADTITEHIKSAIDYHLTGSMTQTAPLQAFAETALKLFADQQKLPPSYGLQHIELRGRSYEPLYLREEIIGALKQLAGYRHALLLITGLRQALAPEAKYWTQRLRREHQAAVSFIDQLALQYATPSTRLTLLYL
jgi:hypothetical protein